MLEKSVRLFAGAALLAFSLLVTCEPVTRSSLDQGERLVKLAQVSFEAAVPSGGQCSYVID